MAMQALLLLGGESPITWAGSLTQEAQPDGSVRPWRLPHEDASLAIRSVQVRSAQWCTQGVFAIIS